MSRVDQRHARELKGEMALVDCHCRVPIAMDERQEQLGFRCFKCGRSLEAQFSHKFALEARRRKRRAQGFSG